MGIPGSNVESVEVTKEAVTGMSAPTFYYAEEPSEESGESQEDLKRAAASQAFPFTQGDMPLMGLTKLLQYEHHCDQTSEELPSRKLVVKSPGPVKYLDFAIAVIIWSPLRI